MGFGELTTLRRPSQGPQRVLPSTVVDSGVVTSRAVDGGSAYGDAVQPSPTMGIVDSVGTDIVSLITILPEHIQATSLSAISGDMGTITAGLITGATIQTGYADPKVVLDPTGIHATNPSGTETFRVDSATGNVTALGGTFTGSSFVGGSFTGVTFTGGTFQTSATNPRVWFDTSGIHATNPSGTQVFLLDAATGNLTATGATITGGTFIGTVFETSAANPKVRIDATGIRMTATDGTTTFYADSSTGVLTLGNPAGSKITFDPALASMQRLYLEGRLVGTGTIMGPSFETGVNNPRMVIDQFGIRAYPPGTFPSATLKDDFNRANVGPPPSGSWLADFRGGGANAFKIVSNRAVPSFAAGDNESGMYWNVLTTTSDHEVFCDINVEADLELWARISWTNPSGVTAYVCEYTASDHSLRVQRYGPGGTGWYTDISSVVNVGFTAGMSIGIRVVGQSITLFHKAAGASVYSQVLQVSDPDPPHPEFTSGDKWGVMCWEMTPGASPLQIDNVGGGDYVPVGGGTPTFAVDTGTGSMSVQGGAITAGLVQTDDEDPRVVMDNYRDAGGVMRGRFRATDATGAVKFLIQDGVVTNTGGTLQSAAANPKVLLGPAGLFSYDSGGNVMFKADPADGGKATLFNSNLTGTTLNTGQLEHRLPAPGVMRPLTWTLTGTQVGALDFDDSGKFSLWAKAQHELVAVAAQPTGIGTETTAMARVLVRAPDLAQLIQQTSTTQNSYLNLQADQALLPVNRADGTQGRLAIYSLGADLIANSTANVKLFLDQRASSICLISVNASGASSRFRLQRGTDASPNGIVDYYQGWLIMANDAAGPSQRDIINTDPSFYTSIGMRFYAAAAGHTGGTFAQYRQFRGNTVGAAVTPGAATISVVIANSNVTSVLFNLQRPEGFQISGNAVAAGAVYYYAQVVMS